MKSIQKLLFILIISSLTSGCVGVFSWDKAKNVKTVKLDPIDDFMGCWYVISAIPNSIEEGAEDSVKEEEEAGESEEIQDINDNEEEENGVATKEVVPESDDGEEHAEDPVGQEEDAESKAIKSIASSFAVLGKFHHDSSSFT